MDHSQVKIEQNGFSFNWDDIDVGNNHLDHSENFFAQKHIKHEKLDELELVNEQMEDKENLSPLNEKQTQLTIKQIKDSPKNSWKPNLLQPPAKPQSFADVPPTIVGYVAAESKPPSSVDVTLTIVEPVAPEGNPQSSVGVPPTLVEPVAPEINPQSSVGVPPSIIEPVADELKTQSSVGVKPTIVVPVAPELNPQSSADVPPTIVEPVAPKLDLTAKPTKAPANIACMWSTQKNKVSKCLGTIATSKSMPPPPHAYEFKDLYERKKKEAMQRRIEEERKMRQFQSRPLPNFKACHENMERKKVVHAVTVPVTPQVLKKSRETEEKRKKKLEEWKRQQQPLKFESSAPNVLKEEPFVPKKTTTLVQSRPFNLRSESRLQARKQYDEEAQRARKEKHKQEEEEREKREEERVRELRKLATFKARPNPFK